MVKVLDVHRPLVHNCDVELQNLASVADLSGDSKLTNAQKHRLLRTALLNLIATIEDGESLPPERALSEQLGAARMTVRKALDLLIDEGYLRRVPGKGVFVTRSRLLRTNSQEPIAHFAVDGTAAAHAKVLELTQGDTGSRIGLRLQLAPSACVVKVVRVCMIEDEAVAVERMYLPCHIFPGIRPEQLEAFDVEESYRSDFGVRVTRSSQVLHAATIDQAESELLGVPVHSPAFFVTTTKTDVEDRVVEYTEAIYRGDRYRFLKVTSSDDPGAVPVQQTSAHAHFMIR